MHCACVFIRTMSSIYQTAKGRLSLNGVDLPWDRPLALEDGYYEVYYGIAITSDSPPLFGLETLQRQGSMFVKVRGNTFSDSHLFLKSESGSIYILRVSPHGLTLDAITQDKRDLPPSNAPNIYATLDWTRLAQ